MPKANILIVEDDAVVAADLAGKLERAGYRSVGIAADGEDAVETAKTLAPDLVLMDIRLAGPMDGIKTAERIQSIRNVPIVIMSASSEAQHAEAAIAAGANFFMTKPFNLTTLKDVITQLMRPPQG